MLYLLIIAATIKPISTQADCDSIKDGENHEFLFMATAGQNRHPENSLAVMICKHGDRITTCKNGTWTPAPEDIRPCPKPKDCDVVALQSSKKLKTILGPHSEGRVKHNEPIYGYCTKEADRNRITYFCKNGEWKVKDSCDQ